MFLRLSLFIVSMLASSMAWAVGFGHVETKSYLSEPLDIRIPLILSDEERKSKLQISLATPREYQVLEQDIPHSYVLLHTDVVKERGVFVLQISSAQALDESFLTLILKVQQGRGNFYKKVQIFLDPAWHQSRQAIDEEVKTNKTVVNKDEVKLTVPVLSTPVQKQTQLGSLPALTLDWARRSSYGPVQSGDNLSEIAYRLRKDKRFSNHQIMLVLFNANPQAFERHDIDRLKKGAFLQVPTSQEVRALLSSAVYRDLEKQLSRQKKKTTQVNTKNGKYLKQEPKRKFHSKVSLGMTESLGVSNDGLDSINDAVVLSRLKKLEPLHEQVMSSSIRIDGINTKVDSLAEEVRILHQKVEALVKVQTTKGAVRQEGEGYGWWWFIVLLMLNILLLLFFFYRRQRKLWQDKLEKAQYKHAYDTTVREDLLMDDVLSINEESDENLIDEPHHPMDEDVPPTVEAESVHTPLVEEDSEDEQVDEKSEKVYVDHAALFEVAIQKEDWKEAEKHYLSIPDNVKRQPRMQAAYIQMLHLEKRVVDRNNTLLDLFKTYDKIKWNRFCSLFDDKAWQQLQDERVISFTGDVIEEGVQRSNLAAEEMESLLAISDLDVLNTTEQGANDESFSSLYDTDDMMDKTVVMNAKDLMRWGEEQANSDEEPHYMDTADVGKWGKVEATAEDDMMLEVDFDIDDEFIEKEPEEETIFTAIDVEFTGEIEPLDEKNKRD